MHECILLVQTLWTYSFFLCGCTLLLLQQLFKLVKKHFPSEWPLVLSLTLALITWLPSKLEDLRHHKSTPDFCKLLILQWCPITMNTHYALLAVSCTSFTSGLELFRPLFPNGSLSIELYQQKQTILQWCILTIETLFSDIPSLSKSTCLLISLGIDNPFVSLHFSDAHPLSKPTSVLHTHSRSHSCLLNE